MGKKRFNNVSGKVSGTFISLGLNATSAVFTADPKIPTVAFPDTVRLTVDPGTIHEEIIDITAHTSGASTATVVRNVEATTNGQNSGAAHSAVDWTHASTAAAYDLSVINGDVAVDIDGNATLQGSIPVEDLIRAQHWDQLAAPTGDVDFNNQKGVNLLPGTIAKAPAALIQLGGWIPDPNTLTRTANTTFTTPTDQTALYKPGTQLKWTDSGGVKYGIVASSAFASSTTTVTMAATADYVMASSPSAGANYLAYTIPPDFPSAFTWAPTFTGITGGDPTGGYFFGLAGGKMLWVAAAGISGTASGTTFGASLPIKTTRTLFAVGEGVDNGGSAFNATTTAVSINTTGASVTLAFFKEPGGAAWTASGFRKVEFSMTVPI